MVKVPLTPAAEAVLHAIGSTTSHAALVRGPKMPRRHRLMLLAAFEILVLGFALAAFFPVRPAGILIETTVTPNHVVT